MKSRLKRYARPVGLSLAAFLSLCGGTNVAQAQGILYPQPIVDRLPPRIPPRPIPIPVPIVQTFYVKNLKVNTTITDAVAETTVEQTFVNDSSVVQEGTYLYPLPEGASPSSFSMTVGGKTIEPKILKADEARQTYESIVRRYRDPALLEYVGRSLVKISVYPIPAHGEAIIKMRYSEVLKPENGLRKYAYSLSTSRFGSRPVGISTVSMKLQTTTPIKNVYSPSHDLSIRRTDDKNATATWEGRNDTSDRDLTLYYSTSGDDVGMSLLSYKSGERDGYFMLLASPRVSVPANRILPKQVVFVLDRTGSMSGAKIEQARKSLLQCLNGLHPQDRFDVITFNESADILTKTLMPATEANVGKAKKFVENIEASGGTNIDEALQSALGLLKNEAGTQKMVVFLTDGLPTIGETDINTILNHVKQQNVSVKTASVQGTCLHSAGLANLKAGPDAARIFCFGLGYDVNVPFLDRIAGENRGDSDYVKPEQNVEAIVSNFFSKVTSPILANLQLNFDGVDVYDVYPKTLPDLFKGSQLVITGRFRGNVNGNIRLNGSANGTPESFHTGAAFGEAGGANTYLPRLWAARKIGFLSDQLRLSDNPGGKQEVIDEIVRLSREYGIITEYTSFLIDDQEANRLSLNAPVSGGMPAGSTLYRLDTLREEVARRAGRNGVQGEAATNQSLRAKTLSNAAQVPSRYQTANGGVNALNAQRGMGGYGGGRGASGDKGEAGPAGAYGPPGAISGDAFYGGRFDRDRNGFKDYSGAKRSPSDANADANPANVVNLQAVGDRTFYRQANNVWQDGSFDSKKGSLVSVQAFSDAHFALLKAFPSLAAYSSVGDEVIVRLGRNSVQIGAKGKEKLTDADWKTLREK